MRLSPKRRRAAHRNRHAAAGQPVYPPCGGALADHGVAARAGRVLLALAGEDASTAVDVIAGPGLDCQVIRNRGAAMILPAGVTKGTGLLAALDELGLWPHNAIATGDAENDLALLRAAEVGAAVSASCLRWQRMPTCTSVTKWFRRGRTADWAAAERPAEPWPGRRPWLGRRADGQLLAGWAWSWMWACLRCSSSAFS